MKITFKKFVIPALVTVMACAPLHAVFAQPGILIVDDVGGTSMKAQCFAMVKKLIDAKLDENVNVTISQNDALYGENSELEAEELGAIQITAPGLGTFSGTFPKLTVLALPYLLTTPEAIQAAVNDPKINSALFSDLHEKGLKLLGIWFNGPREVGRTGDKPILMPDDMKGVKIRVPPGPAYVLAFKQLGANVTTMSFAQVPTALRQGVLDAVEPTPNVWVSSHLDEIAQQITETSYVYDFYIVVVNEQWWDSVAPPTRQIIQDAVDQTTKWNLKNVKVQNDNAFATMRKAGDHLYTLTPDQLAAWKAAEHPLWDSIGTKLVGPDVMRRLIAIGVKYQ